MNIVGRKKRSNNNFDLGKADDVIHELLNNGYSMIDPTDFMSPLIMKFGDVILQGEFLYITAFLSTKHRYIRVA